MKFTVSRDELLTPLNQVAGVVERRQTLPILANVLLVLEGERLSLTGTDLAELDDDALAGVVVMKPIFMRIRFAPEPRIVGILHPVQQYAQTDDTADQRGKRQHRF